jgi:hypothetical protein
VPATVWAPPPAAAGERWRAWLLGAVDRAFLPAHGRRVDLTAHLVDEPHDQRLPAYGQGPDEADGDGCTAETELSAPVTPYWAALIRDQPAASAVTASTSPLADSVSPTSPTPTDPAPTDPAPTDPATAGPVQVALAPTTAGDAADLVFVDLAGTAADDRLGILASRALRDGGLLTVLTHCHHTVAHDRRIRHSRRGENVLGGDDRDRRDFDADTGAGAGAYRPMLVDPTGSVVASAQNADLLYLQHIIIPTRPLTHPDSADQPDVPTATVAQPQSGHRSQLPRRTLHRIAHADLLVFARPAGPTPLPRPGPTPPRAPSGTGTATANLAVGSASSPDDGSRS